MDATVEALDLTRRKNVYDGPEPRDWKTKIPVPMARPDYAFSFLEIAEQQFAKLEDKVGKTAFDTIVESQGYRVPKGEFDRFKGEDNLPLYYYIRPDQKPDAVKVLLVSMGEYQPGRYMAHVEGIWRVTGGSF